MSHGQYRPAVDLYVRSMCPAGAHDRQERVIERIQSMNEAGDVEEVSIVVWGDRISTDTAAGHTDRGRDIPDRIAAFQRWALREGVSLPWVQPRRVGRVATDAHREANSLPVMCLAEYVDGDLTHVTSHADGDTVRCVDDHLARLAGRSGVAEPASPQTEGGH